MDQTEQVFFVSSFTENNFGNPDNYCKLGISVQLNCKYKQTQLKMSDEGEIRKRVVTSSS